MTITMKLELVVMIKSLFKRRQNKIVLTDDEFDKLAILSSVLDKSFNNCTFNHDNISINSNDLRDSLQNVLRRSMKDYR